MACDIIERKWVCWKTFLKHQRKKKHQCVCVGGGGREWERKMCYIMKDIVTQSERDNKKRVISRYSYHYPYPHTLDIHTLMPTLARWICSIPSHTGYSYPYIYIYLYLYIYIYIYIPRIFLLLICCQCCCCCYI